MSSMRWLTEAACGNEAQFTEWTHTDQKSLCAVCPVTADCLTWGLANHEHLLPGSKTVGPVYGGLTPTELHQLARRANT